MPETSAVATAIEPLEAPARIADLPHTIPVARAAPLVPAAAVTPAPAAARPASPALPTGFLRHLLEAIAATTPLRTLQDGLPALKILALAVAAAVALRLTGATLQAIDGLPLVGGLLELVGLMSLLRFLARNALRQQKRAELLARIENLRKQLLG